jgi:hypothetical protein
VNVGDEIDTTCPRCKLILAHVVLFFDADGVVGGVRCCTCGAQHSYRSYRKGRVRKPPPSSRTLKALLEGGSFSQRLAGIGAGPILDYRADRHYRVDDVIRHAKFGLGFVLRAHEGRIEVLFENGVKALVQGSGG